MPERCDICGIVRLESQTFVEERLPFRRAKRYCPACHRRLYHRLFAFEAVVILTFLGLGFLLQAYHRRTTWLDSPALWCPLLVVFQWLMILPHEAGHAAVARLLGFTRVRILVGSGRPLVSFSLFGVPVLLNVIPFGGVTLFDLTERPDRRKYFSVVAAGPLVNLAATAVACYFISIASPFEPATTVSKLFLWANLIVLAENLIPFAIQTPFGRIGNDGFQLRHLLFRWNKPPSLEPARVPLGGTVAEGMPRPQPRAS